MTQGGRRFTEPDRLRDPETGTWNKAELWHHAKGWLAVLVAVGVVAGGVWFGGSWAWDAWMDFRSKEDYVGAGVEDIEVTVPRGSTMAQIGQILQEADVVKSADTFQRYAATRPDEAKTVQAGRYRMRTQISARSAFERLLDPANIIRSMMQLREGQRLTEQIAAMAEASKLPAGDFEAALATPGELGLPAWAGDRPEGFLFPDTYELPDNPTAVEVIRLATTQFGKVSADMDFENRAAASPAGAAYSAVLMASIVEREANRSEDRVRVARVFYNRLAEGMPLQSDATVAYANNVTGRVTTTDAERALDSPYNTYLDANAGKLPPGPITSPSRDAMEAAVSPAEGDWLYFVTVNLDTGETEFNATFEDHLRSVAKWQEFCRTSDKC